MKFSSKSVLLAVILCLGTSTWLWGQGSQWEGSRRELPPPPPLMPPVITNQGQFDKNVSFAQTCPSGSVLFANDSITVILKTHSESSVAQEDFHDLLTPSLREAVAGRRKPLQPESALETIRISFVNPNPSMQMHGMDKQAAKAHYLIGNDPSKWITYVPIYDGVAYSDLWPGVDLFFIRDGGRFICTPFVSEDVDVSCIKLQDANGKAIQFSDINALLSRAVGSGWNLDGSRMVMADRDGSRYLSGTVYSPKSHNDCFAAGTDSSGRLLWITFMGGGSEDITYADSVDRNGYIYVNGFTGSKDFPTTADAYKKKYNGSQDYFTAKLSPSGTKLLYSTYLGVGGGGLDDSPKNLESASEKLLAIIIDDGREYEQVKPLLDLGIPITFAVMPWMPPDCVKTIEAAGCAVFLHAPMEALGTDRAQGGMIRVGQTDEQIEALLDGWHALIPDVTGVSNHMGSMATSDPETVRAVATWAKKQGLFFLDSNTSPVSIAVNVGRGAGVPCMQQDIFLDHREESGVRARVLAMAEIAERTGYSACIGHVGRSVLPDTLSKMIPELQSKGFRFVTVPELYRIQTTK